MSSSAIPTFNGTSTYASDLQQSLTRAVAIASLPLTAMQNQLTTLQGQSTALGTIDTDFANVQTAIQNLDSAKASNSAVASDPTVLQANADSTALAGTYTVNILDPGSQTTAVSSTGLTTVQDPSSTSITSSSTLTLTVNGTSFSIAPASNTLEALVQAINGSGANVNATILNEGSPSAPDYRLSVQSTALGSRSPSSS